MELALSSAAPLHIGVLFVGRTLVILRVIGACSVCVMVSHNHWCGVQSVVPELYIPLEQLRAIKPEPYTLVKEKHAFSIQTKDDVYYLSLDCSMSNIPGWSETDESLEQNIVAWIAFLKALRYCHRKPKHRYFG